MPHIANIHSVVEVWPVTDEGLEDVRRWPGRLDRSYRILFRGGHLHMRALRA